MIKIENKLEWENKICYNNNGEMFKIISYNGTNNILIRFTKTGYEKITSLSNIKKKSVVDITVPTVYGVGVFGEGVHKAKINNKSVIYYKRWQSIIQRCYDIKCESYKNYGALGVTICDEWKNFQNFGDWWVNNWTEHMDDSWDIDKDFLIKNSKIYSPDTCIFLPNELNVVLTKRLHKRGLYPIGVSKKGNSYIAQINKNKEKIHLGCFKTPEEAFNAYKIAKETHLKELADSYKSVISEKVYNALCNYKVEITD